MKQLIFIYAVSILCISMLTARQKLPPDDGIKVRIVVEFGDGRTCEGWGICDVDFIITSSTDFYDRLGGIVGNVSITPDNKHLELAFTRDDLLKYQPEKLALVDGRSEVTFVEGYVFPKEVQEELNAEREVEIKPGTYPLTFIDGLFTIKFPY